MGKQLGFYMTQKDTAEFLNVVQELAPTIVALRDSDVPEVRPADLNEISSGKTLVLWNPAFRSDLQRKWVPDPGYFRLDTLHEPVLEYMPSFSNTWKQKPALGQGRLFGNFEAYLEKPKDFMKWYQDLTKWIRKNYPKNSTSIGGYIGPDAQQFVADGGYLLPGFLPPETPEWEAEIGRTRTLAEP